MDFIQMDIFLGAYAIRLVLRNGSYVHFRTFSILAVMLVRPAHLLRHPFTARIVQFFD